MESLTTTVARPNQKRNERVAGALVDNGLRPSKQPGKSEDEGITSEKAAAGKVTWVWARARAHAGEHGNVGVCSQVLRATTRPAWLLYSTDSGAKTDRYSIPLVRLKRSKPPPHIPILLAVVVATILRSLRHLE